MGHHSSLVCAPYEIWLVSSKNKMSEQYQVELLKVKLRVFASKMDMTKTRGFKVQLTATEMHGVNEHLDLR
jgi:hypothetical protein